MVKLQMTPGTEAPSVAGAVLFFVLQVKYLRVSGQKGFPMGCNTIKLLGGEWKVFKGFKKSLHFSRLMI